MVTRAEEKPISKFIEYHYRHFNSRTLVEASKAYRKVLDDGGKMLVSIAGAMSTAEIGLSLAEMIRQDKVHAISCTGANLEEDIFNLVAHDHYRVIPNWRELSPKEEEGLLDEQLNRVTDTCIPEEEAMREIERWILPKWKAAHQNNQRFFPHEFLYQAIEEWDKLPESKRPFQIDPKNSWVLAAWKKKIPLIVPGWEDSTLGNFYVAQRFKGQLKGDCAVRPGLEYMTELVEWYGSTSQKHPIGFFQIGGGIAGDFPICVVPLLGQDIKKNVSCWAYFCQISDSTTSYGSYSGAVPNEKITWGKLSSDTPRFVIESDASIVAPLIFAYVLGW